MRHPRSFRPSTFVELAELLESIGVAPPMDEIVEWNPERFEAAAEWAMSIHFAEDDQPPRPDFLAAHDSRRCRRCACTDSCGCPSGCSWVAADLCSECASPTSLRELLAFLARRPRVLYTGFDGATAPEAFSSAVESGLWFIRQDGEEQFLPVNCRLGRAAAAEGGLAFDGDGFTFTKFGRSVRYEYRRGPNC